MDDLISRQAAVEIVDRYNKSHMILKGKPMLGAASIVIELEALPSAQPERKKGHWIEVDDHYNRISGRCSVCGWESHMYEDDVVGMDFCPNCGARLQEGEENG